MKKLISALAFTIILMGGNAYGQKIGQVNFDEILVLLPEYDSFQVKLEKYRNKLGEELEYQTNEIELQYKNLEREQSKAVPNKKTIEFIQMNIQNMGQTLEQNKLALQDSFTTRQKALFLPIQDKMKKAIEIVAKEKGYTQVLDSSQLLYSREADNLDEAVRKQLGIVKKP
ncbi:MAG: OmpH family outer membrane protein [Bacteroidia bacterium]|nr:OmpH family outer membrane protein [Bacteroidia bacterium]